jgi:tetratricopeptide (TPR) repeat protein
VAHYHATLGNALASAGRDDEALISLERALALSPGDPDLAAARAGVLARLGRHDEARAILEVVLKARPDSLRALTAIAGMKKVSADDALPGLFRQASRFIGSQPFQRQVGFFFAWGKVLDDIGECDNAFRCLETANQLQRRTRCYDRDAFERGIEAVQQFFAGMSAGPCDDAHLGDRPVFVVGMPRSGTTLTEQVIAAHPRALGAGELTTLEESLSEAAGIRRPNVADLYQHLAARSEAEVAAAMRAYLGEIGRLGNGRARVVDKMPGNFVHIGLIRRFLPNARIVHVVRNPVDTLLSCFQQNFERGQAFSNDLADAAHHYHRYARLIDFWREREPDAFCNVRYEELVADPESTARTLIDHVGLDWNPACLAPHRQGRSVRTASQWQVRQPVYTSSVGRWRRYEKQLRPLLDHLDAYGIDWRD